jgi:hypothetical protein
MKLGSPPCLSVASLPPLVCSRSQKRCILSPLFATFTHSAICKSFPCHSCENTRGGHGLLFSYPLFARSFALSFSATSAESAHYALVPQNTRDIRTKSEHPAKDVRPERGEGPASLRAGASPDPVGMFPWPIPPFRSVDFQLSTVNFSLSPLDRTLTKNSPVNPLELTLTKSLDLKSRRITLLRKRWGGKF